MKTLHPNFENVTSELRKRDIRICKTVYPNFVNVTSEVGKRRYIRSLKTLFPYTLQVYTFMNESINRIYISSQVKQDWNGFKIPKLFGTHEDCKENLNPSIPEPTTAAFSTLEQSTSALPFKCKQLHPAKRKAKIIKTVDTSKRPFDGGQHLFLSLSIKRKESAKSEPPAFPSKELFRLTLRREVLSPEVSVSLKSLNILCCKEAWAWLNFDTVAMAKVGKSTLI